jgi:hypothetical protein
VKNFHIFLNKVSNGVHFTHKDTWEESPLQGGASQASEFSFRLRFSFHLRIFHPAFIFIYLNMTAPATANPLSAQTWTVSSPFQNKF